MPLPLILNSKPLILLSSEDLTILILPGINSLTAEKLAFPLFDAPTVTVHSVCP